MEKAHNANGQHTPPRLLSAGTHRLAHRRSTPSLPFHDLSRRPPHTTASTPLTMAQNPAPANNPQPANPNAQPPASNANGQQQPASTSGQASSSSSSFAPIPITAAAGGLTITQPQQTATSFFKIASGEMITFAWNFTSLLATPTSLTVSAVCDNGNTYPVGPTDGIIPGTATQVVWDLGKYQQDNPNNPLAQASYTLNIWDDRGPGASIKPGFMQENSALRFAMYTPQAYTPIADGERWLPLMMEWDR